MEPAQRITAAQRYLRRTKTLAECEALAEKAFGDLQKGVTITSLGYEGGSGTGQITMEPGELLDAIEVVILEKKAAAGETTPSTERTSGYARQRNYPYNRPGSYYT